MMCLPSEARYASEAHPPDYRPHHEPHPLRLSSAQLRGTPVQLYRHLPKPLPGTQLAAATAVLAVAMPLAFTLPASAPPHNSARLQGVTVMFYVLGLSYGAVALGHPPSKSAVYYAVQAARERVPT